MPGYTAPEILLFIAAIGLVLTNTITAWRQGNKLNVISEKTAIIEGHVNSKETKYIEEMKAKDTQIELLKSVIESQNKDKALLAQAVALRSRGDGKAADPTS
jgi:hypothetical protein